jgi:hypothetical protein
MLPAIAQTLNFLQSDIGGAGITVGISIVMWAAGFIILRTRIVPVWLARVSFVLGVAGLAGAGTFSHARLGGYGWVTTFSSGSPRTNRPRLRTKRSTTESSKRSATAEECGDR